MVNASLNWASIVGILLVISGIPLFAFSVSSISRISSSSSDYVFRILNLIGLLFIPFLCGGILFFQGWRLDPILQFACALLAGGIAVEMVSSFIDDYLGWRNRTVRATAAIVVDSQPDDSAEENK